MKMNGHWRRAHRQSRARRRVGQGGRAWGTGHRSQVPCQRAVRPARTTRAAGRRGPG